jgi:hypothetical protein
MILEDGGTIETYGGNAHGIYVTNIGDDAAVDYAMIVSSGHITTNGNDSHAINVTDIIGDVTIDVAGAIDALGDGSNGIHVSDASGNVNITTDADSEIYTSGTNGHVIHIDEAGDASDADVEYVHVFANGSISTYDDNAYGIYVMEATANVTIDVTGPVTTHGFWSHGIYVRDTIGTVAIDISGAISASGLYANALYLAGNDEEVEINISAAVSGGAGEGAGIRIADGQAVSTTINVLDGGSLGALSDRAIISSESNLIINNYGTITGIVELGDGDALFNNYSSNSWLLRYGSDTATADFGDGTDTFVNTGVLSLLKGTQTLWQGELLGLETFTHRGEIDLSDGTAGDTLAISGEFQSDGGALYLDTVLDDGATPQTDLLDLETVTMPNDNPTLVHIENGGGTGGQTTGNGIKIIEADTSADGAFVLAERWRFGAYEYELVEIGEDWYLSSFLIAATGEYPALVSAVLSSWQSGIGFLHDRMKVLIAGDNAPIEPASYGSADARGGFWLNATGARQEIDTGTAYEQRLARLEGGLDHRTEVAGGRLGFGLFAGYGQSWQEFQASTSEAKSDFARAAPMPPTARAPSTARRSSNMSITGRASRAIRPTRRKLPSPSMFSALRSRRACASRPKPSPPFPACA